MTGIFIGNGIEWGEPSFFVHVFIFIDLSKTRNPQFNGDKQTHNTKPIRQSVLYRRSRGLSGYFCGGLASVPVFAPADYIKSLLVGYEKRAAGI